MSPTTTGWAQPETPEEWDIKVAHLDVVLAVGGELGPVLRDLLVHVEPAPVDKDEGGEVGSWFLVVDHTFVIVSRSHGPVCSGSDQPPVGGQNTIREVKPHARRRDAGLRESAATGLRR